MKDGISGAALPQGFPYAEIIDTVAYGAGVSPCLVGAIKMNETGLGQGPASENDISGDGGHGLFQLTSSYPQNWSDPQANTSYAVNHFIVPAWQYWAGEGLQGDDLVRAIAATYNAGLGNAQAGHRIGDIGIYTTNQYDERALAHYTALIAGTIE